MDRKIEIDLEEVCGIGHCEQGDQCRVAVRRAYTLFRWERVARSLAALYGDAEASANAVPKHLPAPAVALPGVVAAA